jgi:hypothetical protein
VYPRIICSAAPEPLSQTDRRLSLTRALPLVNLLSIANMGTQAATAASLDAILHQITTSNNTVTLNQTIRTALPKESREMILAGPLASGQDPLSILDIQVNTLGVLYIL